jgi:hypothetical protein
MINNLHEDAENNEIVDMVKSYNGMTFNFIGDFAFAEPFDSLRNRTDHPFMLFIFQGAKIGAILQNLVILIPGLKALSELLIKFVSSFDYETFVGEKVDRRIQSGDRERPDPMTGILKHNTEDGTGITRDELVATVLVLLAAGSETTATLLSGATYLLLTNLRVMKELQGEVRSTFATADDITIVGSNRLPYLFAVLEESLRPYLPVPVALPRITPQKGRPYAGT